MEFHGTGKPPASPGRRTSERRDAPRESSDRRTGHDRRADQLGRYLVFLFRSAKLQPFGQFVVLLIRRELFGPFVLFVSAFVYFLLYAREKGVIFAGLLVLTLIVHEGGHFLATLLCRFRPHWPWFIPYLGAMMRLARVKSRAQEAIIACGGPLMGSIVASLSLVVLLNAPLSEELAKVLHAFVVIGAFLNWFNLIPIPPLDGGRMTQASHWIFQVFGFGLLLLLFRYFLEPVFLIIWMIIVIDRFMEYPLPRFLGAVALLWVYAGVSFLGADILLAFNTASMSGIEKVVFFLFGLFLTVMFRPKKMPRLFWESLFTGIFLASGVIALFFVGSPVAINVIYVLLLLISVRLVVMCRPWDLPGAGTLFKKDKDIPPPLPQLPVPERIFWGVAWFVLFSFTTWLFVEATKYGPIMF